MNLIRCSVGVIVIKAWLMILTCGLFNISAHVHLISSEDTYMGSWQFFFSLILRKLPLPPHGSTHTFCWFRQLMSPYCLFHSSEVEGGGCSNTEVTLSLHLFIFGSICFDCSKPTYYQFSTFTPSSSIKTFLHLFKKIPKLSIRLLRKSIIFV